VLWDDVYPRWARAHDYLNTNTSLHVTARQVGQGLRCTVEYNPSRVIDPYGHSLCPAEEVFPTVARIMNQLRGRVDLDAKVADILVTRLDVARDFRVSDPQFFLTGLRPLHRSHGANPSLWFDERSGAASSLRVGTSRAANGRRPDYVTLYDKHLKAGAPETQGILRWEMSGRTWPERYGGIKTLAELTPERVQALARDRWSWSRMGDVVVGEDEPSTRPTRPSGSRRSRGVASSAMPSPYDRGSVSSRGRIASSIGFNGGWASRCAGVPTSPRGSTS
jgi:hypothetical protein